MLRHVAAEIRDGRAVVAFALEAWRDDGPQSFSNGGEVSGIVDAGQVVVEQLA